VLHNVTPSSLAVGGLKIPSTNALEMAGLGETILAGYSRTIVIHALFPD
jgi:hypothetical protein